MSSEGEDADLWRDSRDKRSHPGYMSNQARALLGPSSTGRVDASHPLTRRASNDNEACPFGA